MKHIEFTKLIERIESILSQAEESEVSQHLASCDECLEASKKVEEFFRFAKATPLEEVSHNITANLLNIYKPKVKEQKSASLVEKIFGELVFDDWQTVLHERLSFSDSRQLLYRVKNFDVDIRLHFEDGKCSVNGQIFPDLKSKATLKLISGDAIKATELLENGEFKFSLLDKGIYNLVIDFDNTQIEIEQILI
jgi:hypothetical protein